MPTTRKAASSTRGRSGPTKGQSTLSFHSKVTKNVATDAKKAALSPSVAKVELPAQEEVEEVAQLDEEQEEQLEEEQEAETQVPEKTEAELKAEKITEPQIEKYWKAIEKERTAPRIHQQDVSTHEKILRYFDVSSQYGPCIGITRTKRWNRAEKLGLNPPVEVLAVLMKEEGKGDKGYQTAQMDKIMSSIAVGAGA